MKKPVQQGSNGGSDATSSFGYDSHQLFVTQTTNELGLVIHTDTDVATGTVIRRQGPNRKGNIWNEETRTIDGFGRTLAHSVSIDSGDSYELLEVERITYADRQFISKRPV